MLYQDVGGSHLGNEQDGQIGAGRQLELTVQA